jgi:hypothetical protein
MEGKGYGVEAVSKGVAGVGAGLSAVRRQVGVEAEGPSDAS